MGEEGRGRRTTPRSAEEGIERTGIEGQKRAGVVGTRGEKWKQEEEDIEGNGGGDEAKKSAGEGNFPPVSKSRESLFQGKIADLTACSICAEIFTQPKILPCVHTFCLRCLETYGKEKKPGDETSCPICRSNFAIPTGGFCNLPNNFFIKEMVEIGKLAMTPANEDKCNVCPEGEEQVGKMYCIDCNQILCERCSKSHKKIKHCQNHQVVELESRLNVQEFNTRNSYCEDHPKQLITMYCTEHNAAICLFCCVESHQSHKCINVEKIAGNSTERLKEDLKKVTGRLPECNGVEQKLDKYKKEFLEEISKTEKEIFEAGTQLKTLIDQHTEKLVKDLQLLKEKNLKVFEITKQEVERFRVMIDSFSRYSEELLSRGSPVDVCRAADQMHERAKELEKLPVICTGEPFCCDAVAFQPSSFETLNDAVGKLTVAKSPDRTIGFENRPTAEEIRIRVKISEKCLIVALHPNAKMEELYSIVCEQYANELEPEDLQLIYKDEVLEYNTEKTLQDYNILHQSTLTTVFRLKEC